MKAAPFCAKSNDELFVIGGGMRTIVGTVRFDGVGVAVVEMFDRAARDEVNH